MKTCPSCNNECEEDQDLCHSCGHSFDGNLSKRTMMGFPGLNAIKPNPPEEDDPGKQTLFGFPAQKAGQVDVSEAIDSDDASTSIISGFGSGRGPDDFSDFEELAADDNDEEDDEYEDPWSRAFITQTGSQKPIERSSLITNVGGEDEDPRAGFGTMMGMNVADLKRVQEAQAPIDAPADGAKSTMFSFPAIDDTIPQVPELQDADSEVEREVSSTVAWNPNVAADDESPEEAVQRKAVLEKIRSSSKPRSLDTAQGIPSAKAKLPKLKPPSGLKPLGSTSGPGTGVIKGRNKTQSATKDESLKSESSPLVGKGSYIVAGDDIGDFDDDLPTEMTAPPAFLERFKTSPKLEKPSPKVESPSPLPTLPRPKNPSGLQDVSDPEFAFADTGIAPGNLVDGIAFKDAKTEKDIPALAEVAAAVVVNEEDDRQTEPHIKLPAPLPDPEPETERRVRALDPWSMDPSVEMQSPVSNGSLLNAPAGAHPAPLIADPSGQMNAPLVTEPSGQHIAPFAESLPKDAPNKPLAKSTTDDSEKWVVIFQQAIGAVVALVLLASGVLIVLESDIVMLAKAPGILAVLMGVIALLASIAPVSTKIRSSAFVVFFLGSLISGVASVVFGLAGIASFAFALAAVGCIVAALWPTVARKF